MDYEGRLSISYYEKVASINVSHRVDLVRHRETGNFYVKKVLSIYNPAVYEFLRAHRIPGIPRIYALYEEENELTVIEDFISGTVLSDLISTHALTLSETLQIMQDLCRIFAQLHENHPPVIHRDIKPSNIMIDPYGHAYLLDFNAAKLEHSDSQNLGNPDTVLLGTAGYAAPEQYGFGASTIQTDVYGLGVLLREMVNSLPREDRLPAFSSIIASCTQLDPALRLKDTSELSDRLKELEASTDSKRSQISEYKKHDSPASIRRFLPPGFRSRTPWKMAIASVSYLVLFWSSLTLIVEDAVSVQSLWIQRIGVLIWGLLIILCSCNYCGIQNLLPLCRHPNRMIRILGVILLDALVTLLVLFLIVISIS